MASMQSFSAAPVLDSIIATMVDGLIAIDAESRIRLFNPACERIFGWSEEEVLGEYCQDGSDDDFSDLEW